MPKESQLQDILLQRLGLRIGPEMARYLRQRLESSASAIPIIAADARSGLPLRRMIDPSVLRAATNSTPTPTQS